MKPPEDANRIVLLHDQVLVRDKYKKTTCIVSKKAHNDPEESSIG